MGDISPCGVGGGLPSFQVGHILCDKGREGRSLHRRIWFGRFFPMEHELGATDH